ncbi:uncharacterized protein GGS25DRAFT_406610 [Hypoxylon fragiforme]|uniref:uncharacterized protein n=1 Tax=Hypoxylon fragiforme TaxID=63214 RepID=UPI0020C66D01|nr:uncharacterized protein GGS25DRAFT_406610 [Hypoxylon fragiforme]KAI2604961.1 hypothetical protein GGS25DRAFT_406610 [Hypoxylon fragiforme]
MKSLKMSRVLGTIRKKTSNNNGSGPSSAPVATNGESPEDTVHRCVKAFCISGSTNAGDEVLFLPPIVDAAESSPVAAAECARLIRKYLKKDYWTKPSYQYNAIMLIRILADNPGETFTRNLDQKFADTSKELLRSVRDHSVRQMMMETLDSFEKTKSYDEGLALIIDMWKTEKERAQQLHGASQPPAVRPYNAPPINPHSQNYFARSHSNRKLPDPVELASRLEEARTSAKLLHQVVTNTPPVEVLSNDLIKEFADRCTSASRSIQMYMTAEDPAPDNDTMEHLIDTNEQLQASLSLHQRAMLNAKKLVATMEPPPREQSVSPIESEPNDYSLEPPPVPRKANGKGKEREHEPSIAGPSRTHTPSIEQDNPFRDPETDHDYLGSKSHAAGGSGSGKGASSNFIEEPRLAFEPFHPGFESTPSYLDRQESALENETMHGGAGGGSGSGPRGSRGSRGDDEGSDIYDVTPSSKQKEPIYRY